MAKIMLYPWQMDAVGRIRNGSVVCGGVGGVKGVIGKLLQQRIREAVIPDNADDPCKEKKQQHRTENTLDGNASFDFLHNCETAEVTLW